MDIKKMAYDLWRELKAEQVMEGDFGCKKIEQALRSAQDDMAERIAEEIHEQAQMVESGSVVWRELMQLKKIVRALKSNPEVKPCTHHHVCSDCGCKACGGGKP